MEGQKLKPERREETTILLLGETGVGKSTWINGFANYLEYETLEDAETKPVLCLIPTTFTMQDDDYQQHKISVGCSNSNTENEDMEVGHSSTQYPQSYVFTKGGSTVRVIDTPGIGDVRGAKQDKKNFERILQHISHLENIHVICILLKPNHAKLNLTFSFCVKELLTHLHRDASRNIVFCFTNSRGTFFKPGDTLPVLKKLLDENLEIQIPLNRSNIYCLDNEAVRFLYALKNGVKFSEDDRRNYANSWERSAGDINRLLNHAANRVPHSVTNTLSLNKARQTILVLRTPLAEISRNIQLNVALGKTQREELRDAKSCVMELSKKLYIHETDVHITPLKEPRTICTAAKCVQFIRVGRQLKTNYTAKCHSNCGTGKQKHYKIENIVGHKSLKKCSAFDTKTGLCKSCECSWKTHMKIMYETHTEVRFFGDTSKQKEIDREETAIEEIQKFLQKLEVYLEELDKEEREITSACVIFATFLKQHAITPYNNHMEEYLCAFIAEERKKVTVGGDPAVLIGLEEMQRDFKDQLRALQSTMTLDRGYAWKVSIQDLENCFQKLYDLKHSGPRLKRMLDTFLNTERSTHVVKRVERIGNYSVVTTETVGSTRNSMIEMAGSDISTPDDPPSEIFHPSAIDLLKADEYPDSIADSDSGIFRDVDNDDNIGHLEPEAYPDEPSLLEDFKQMTLKEKVPPIPPPRPGKLEMSSRATSLTRSTSTTLVDPIVKANEEPPKSKATVFGEDVPVIPRAELNTKERLGAGGFGVVMSGNWNGTECAIKQVRTIVTNQIDYEDILQESRIQYNLRHPNIVQLFGMSYANDLWLVMQLIHGVDLYTLILDPRKKSKKKMSIATKVNIALQATGAISYIHSKGYLHNDIKPDNMIFENGTGKLFLCDFGITRYLGALDVRTFSIKYTTSFAGTLPYIAPECFKRDETKKYIRPTFKSDIWALGAVFTELITERSLFIDDNAVYKCKLLEDYSQVNALVQTLPSYVLPIIPDALDESPAKRPTANEMNTFFTNLSVKFPLK